MYCKGDINKDAQPFRIGVSRSRSGASEIRINREKISKSSELASYLSNNCAMSRKH